MADPTQIDQLIADLKDKQSVYAMATADNDAAQAAAQAAVATAANTAATKAADLKALDDEIDVIVAFLTSLK